MLAFFVKTIYQFIKTYSQADHYEKTKLIPEVIKHVYNQHKHKKKTQLLTTTSSIKVNTCFQGNCQNKRGIGGTPQRLTETRGHISEHFKSIQIIINKSSNLQIFIFERLVYLKISRNNSMFKGEQLRPEECDEMLKIEVELSLLGAFSDLDCLITIITNTQRNFNSSNVTIYRAKIRLQSNQSEEALEDIVQVKKTSTKNLLFKIK